MPDGEVIYEGLRRALPAVARIPGECWIVGGSVRDIVLGRGPKDVDCAAPSAAGAAESFAKVTGGRKICLATKPLETWRVVFNGIDWDFTDLEGGSIDSDLSRRDFTIGAVAVSAGRPHELRDPFGGLEDVDRKIVRMVSESNLVDDPLRMIRAVRMSARLGFEIDSRTRAAIKANVALLRESASERITAELDEILLAPDVRRSLELLVALNLDGEVFPDGLDEKAIKRCAGVFSPDLVIRYAAIFAGRADALSEHVDKARWSTDRRRNVSNLLELVNATAVSGDGLEDPLPLLVHDHGVRTARRAAELLAAIDEVELATRLSSLVRSRGSALEGMSTLLDGNSIRELVGIGEGPEVGRLQRLLVEAQIRGEVRTLAEAEEFVRRAGSTWVD